MNLLTNDKYDFIECVAAFAGTFYGQHSISRKYQSDKTIFYPQLGKHSIEELKAYFMPMILDGITFDRHDKIRKHKKNMLASTKKVGLDNVPILTVAELFDGSATKCTD
jgi:hypothetical protein